MWSLNFRKTYLLKYSNLVVKDLAIPKENHGSVWSLRKVSLIVEFVFVKITCSKKVLICLLWMEFHWLKHFSNYLVNWITKVLLFSMFRSSRCFDINVLDGRVIFKVFIQSNLNGLVFYCIYKNSLALSACHPHFR